MPPAMLGMGVCLLLLAGIPLLIVIPSRRLGSDVIGHLGQLGRALAEDIAILAHSCRPTTRLSHIKSKSRIWKLVSISCHSTTAYREPPGGATMLSALSTWDPASGLLAIL